MSPAISKLTQRVCASRSYEIRPVRVQLCRWQTVQRHMNEHSSPALLTCKSNRVLINTNPTDDDMYELYDRSCWDSPHQFACANNGVLGV